MFGNSNLNYNNSNNGKSQVIKFGVAMLVLVVVVIVVVSIISINTDKPTATVGHPANQVVLYDDVVDEFYDHYSSESFQAIDQAVIDYFTNIYPKGEVLTLAKKEQTGNGDYRWTLSATNSGNTHTMKITDDGGTVIVDIDGKFKRSYSDEPHLD